MRPTQSPIRSPLKEIHKEVDSQLPHSARPDGLAEGGASCFCVRVCIRDGYSLQGENPAPKDKSESDNSSIIYTSSRQSAPGHRARGRSLPTAVWIFDANPNQ